MSNESTYLNEVMEIFMARFAPCETIDQATHFFSTDEIYQILRDAGYRFMIEEQKFLFSLKWLLRTS